MYLRFGEYVGISFFECNEDLRLGSIVFMIIVIFVFCKYEIVYVLIMFLYFDDCNKVVEIFLVLYVL